MLCGTNSRRIVMDDVRNSRTSVNTEISKCGINNESPKFMVGLSQKGLSTGLKQILSENISLFVMSVFRSMIGMFDILCTRKYLPQFYFHLSGLIYD